MDDFAGDLVDLLDGLHIDQAVIGGLSMGGYITFALFRHAARYFRGMVLADTRAQADAPQAAEGRQRMLQAVRERGAVAAADEMLPKLVCEATRVQSTGGRRRAPRDDRGEFERNGGGRDPGPDDASGCDARLVRRSIVRP